jgi:hypothetical protein
MSELKEITHNLLKFLNIEYEDNDSSLDVLLPENLQKEWNVPEYTRFDFENQLSDDVIPVNLESDWLEKFLQSLQKQGRSSFIEPDVKQSKKNPDFDRMIAKDIILLNAIYKVRSFQETSSFYSTVVVKAVATSDEKREELFALTINESNFLKANHLTDYIFQPIYLHGSTNFSSYKKDFKTGSELNGIFSFLIESECKQKFSHFLNGMERRMKRDLDRLWQYYTDMQNQIVEKTAAKWKKDNKYDLRLEQQRLQSIEKEYLSKISDIQRKYSISLDYEATQWLRTKFPVFRLEVDVQRRKNTRKIFLDYNTMSRKLDSLHCENCGNSSPEYEVQDDTLKFIGSCCINKVK